MVISGALKVYTGAHEVIVTIMLNYVAINITDYLADWGCGKTCRPATS